MPLVRIKHDPKVVSSCLDELRANIQKIVAQELTCGDKGGSLLPEHVEVEFVQDGPRDITNGQDIKILVIANDFPSRKKNLEERRRKIIRRLRKLPSDENTFYQAYVWILLGEGEFGELVL